MKSQIRIQIKVKSWIRIQLKVKSWTQFHNEVIYRIPNICNLVTKAKKYLRFLLEGCESCIPSSRRIARKTFSTSGLRSLMTKIIDGFTRKTKTEVLYRIHWKSLLSKIKIFLTLLGKNMKIYYKYLLLTYVNGQWPEHRLVSWSIPTQSASVMFLIQCLIDPLTWIQKPKPITFRAGRQAGWHLAAQRSDGRILRTATTGAAFHNHRVLVLRVVLLLLLLSIL